MLMSVLYIGECSDFVTADYTHSLGLGRRYHESCALQGSKVRGGF